MISLVRSLTSDESFFLQEVTGSQANGPGEIIFAPQLPGDIEILDVGSRQYILNEGAFLACDAGVTIENKLNSRRPQVPSATVS